MKLMTSAVFVAELYGPLLLFVPIHAVRLFITIGLIALQVRECESGEKIGERARTQTNE